MNTFSYERYLFYKKCSCAQCDQHANEIIGKDNMAKAKLGSGSRFKAVEKSAAKSGAANPAAVAAAAGIKKYGEKKMEKMAQAGKKKA